MLHHCPTSVQVSGSVLICDSINQTGIDILKKASMKVDYKPNILTDELLAIVKEYQVIIVRSRTKITRQVIQAATKAKIIARAGVGLDNIDVSAAEEKGIRVINAPEEPSPPYQNLL